MSQPRYDGYDQPRSSKVPIINLAARVLQIPLAVYYLRAGKRLIDHYYLRSVDFYADKILSLLLGVGVGAAFGATRDLNRAYEGGSEPTIHDFFDLSYVAAVAILIACLGCTISSNFSSLALSKDE
ncbi:hypothetical protein ACH5RR_039146 [Cinchona calisaya]|uniref:CASP-like protein n=1 Tax=Cinchona calisaya TaxID=153742 RepID=A0ABD2XXY7_9GENT